MRTVSRSLALRSLPTDRYHSADARALFERVIGTFSADKARPLWDRWARYEYQYGDLGTAQKLEKRMSEVYLNGTSSTPRIPHPPLTLSTDPPIKRFAERHKYLTIDSIAVRDLGFVPTRQGASSSGSSGMLGRTDTLQSIVSESTKTSVPTPSSSSKRASSPDRRREDSRDYPSKRARASSPGRGRDRDRWDSSGSHRRHGSPVWERDRDRDGPPSSSSSRRLHKEEREEDKSVQLPNILSWFVGTLPAPTTFDGVSTSPFQRPLFFH